MTTKKIGVRYIQPKQIITLDDIEFGELKRGIYVCTSTTRPPNLKEGDLVYEIDTKRLTHVTSDNQEPEPIGVVSWVDEEHQVIIDDITNKYITLLFTPLKDTVEVYICGIFQRKGKDYDVIDNRLVWAGFELENELEAGDEINIRYVPA